MNFYQTELSIDFGEVGYRKSKQQFQVRLVASELTELIRAAKNANRVYELMLIDRPGDVWDYVWVVIETVPTSIRERYLQAWREARPSYAEHPCPLNQIPSLKILECATGAQTDPIRT